jgi:hypothetical protein
MAVYPLKGLKDIRERRLNDSTNARILKAKQLDQTKLELKNKKQALEDYIAWRVEEEKRRYEKLMKGRYPVSEIQKFNASIMQLYTDELTYQEAVRKAENEVAKAQKEFDAAQEFERQSMKKLKKLESHEEIWAYNEKIYAERMADQELEDFRVPNKSI